MLLSQSGKSKIRLPHMHARDPAGRISTPGLLSVDLAVLHPYYQHLWPKLLHYSSHALVVRDIYFYFVSDRFCWNVLLKKFALRSPRSLVLLWKVSLITEELW